MQHHIATLATNQFPAHAIPMNEPTNPYGDLIRTARLGKGWNQDMLGQALGRDKGWVSREESGRTNLPTIEDFRALCAVLNIPLRALLEAKGYLDPAEAEPGIAYAVPDGSARAHLLDALAVATDDEVRAVADLATTAMRLARSAYGGNRDYPAHSRKDTDPTNRSA